MPSPANVARLDPVIRAIDPFIRTMGQLAQRWSDESQYESWSDYEQAMKRALPTGAQFAAASKRPFACRFRLANRRFEVRVTASSIELNEFAATLPPASPVGNIDDAIGQSMPDEKR
jgi:hypothetical protein